MCDIVGMGMALEITDGDRFLNIEYEYLDSAKRARGKTDYIIYDSTTIKESRSRSAMKGNNAKGRENENPLSGKVVAYKQHLGEINKDWESVVKSLAEVANETCRHITLTHLESSILNDRKEASSSESLQKLRFVVDVFLQNTGEKEAGFLTFWEKKVDRSSVLTKPGQLYSMRSSIGREMPTVRGIFDDDDEVPYLPSDIELDFKAKTKSFESDLRRRMGYDDSPEPLPEPVVPLPSATKIFTGKMFLISESLRNKFMGAHKDRIDELITNQGGRVEYQVRSNVSKNIFLVCTVKDHEEKSTLVKEGMRENIPMVTEEFIIACVRAHSFLNWKDFRPQDAILKKIYGKQ